MDTAEPTPIRISRNCEEISAHNFYKLRDTGDLQWLSPSFEGWGDIKDKLPENAQEVADDIADEYSILTKNNKTLQYMELVDDTEIAATRIYGASILLDNINRRWYMMAEHVRDEYVKTLGKWNFILDVRKPLADELKRLYRQVKAAKTKLKRLEKEKESLEKEFKKDGTDVIQLKVNIQNILKRDIDLRKISIKEWHYTLESIPRKKSA